MLNITFCAKVLLRCRAWSYKSGFKWSPSSAQQYSSTWDNESTEWVSRVLSDCFCNLSR